ncbi:MAG: GGDEF domain-containing protein [Butyrivibrio sp.]|nr:GGDEF domain-containing protein [Butyrivibrio sp.]
MNIENYDQEVISLNKEMLDARSTMSPTYITLGTKFVRKAKEVDDNNLLGYAYYYLADAYYLLSSDYREFNNNLMNAIEYLQIGGDAEHLARCYNLLGIDALNHGNNELALDFFYTGLINREEIEDSGIPGFMEFNMGHVYDRLNDVKEALSCVLSAYKSIRRNKRETLYYRNILYCYCFEAGCYIKLGKPDAVKKCLSGIEKLESTKECNPDFFNSYAVIDTRMRSYHFLGDEEQFNKYLGLVMGIIRDGKYTLDNMEDVFETTRFFMRIGKQKEAKEIVRCTKSSLGEFNISNLKLDYARLRCELYSGSGSSPEGLQALEDFYKYSAEFEKERIINYHFFAGLRKKLADTEKENLALSKQAETDPLTGLGNRYGLNKYADYAFDIAFENKTSLAVEILDVDDFKYYNDTYGHQSGDACLKKIGEILGDICSKNSSVHAYRYGGDEFVIIYEGMTDEEVLKNASDIREKVTSMKISSSRSKEETAISVSQGIRNSVPTETNKLWDYMHAADIALYDVKERKKGEINIIHKVVHPIETP